MLVKGECVKGEGQKHAMRFTLCRVYSLHP